MSCSLFQPFTRFFLTRIVVQNVSHKPLFMQPFTFSTFYTFHFTAFSSGKAGNFDVSLQHLQVQFFTFSTLNRFFKTSFAVQQLESLMVILNIYPLSCSFFQSLNAFISEKSQNFNVLLKHVYPFSISVFQPFIRLLLSSLAGKQLESLIVCRPNCPFSCSIF